MFSQLMKLVCKLLLIIFVSSVGFGANPKIQDRSLKVCLKQAMNQKNPPDRDNAKLFCLEKFSGASFSTCLDEAKKLEYLTNSQEALKSCYFSRPKIWSARNCVGVAKQLHTIVDRDSMCLDCISQLEARQISFINCMKISDSFEQLHYKERFEQVCQKN